MIIIPDIVSDHPTLKESEKTLFGRILGECLASTERTCTLSNPELAERCGCNSVTTVSSGIKTLVGAGFLVSDIDRKKGNDRTLSIDPTLLQKFGIALLDLLQKFGIAPEPISENCKTPITENWYSTPPLSENWYRVGWGIRPENEQVRRAITDFWSRGAAKTGQVSIRTTKRDNIEYRVLINKIHNTLSIKYSSRQKNRKNSEVTEPATLITVSTAAGKLAIVSADLAGVVEIRGADPERVGGFVESHSGNHYNSVGELRNLVRAWLKQAKPSEVKAPRLTLEERKQEFRNALNAYHKANPKKYPIEFYRQFYDHWTQPTKTGTRMEFETKSSFYLPTKLAFSYKNIYQRYNNKANGNTGATKQTVTLTADDLNGDRDHLADGYPDDSFEDVSGSEGNQAVRIEIGGF